MADPLPSLPPMLADPIPEKLRLKTWTTREGRKLSIAKMGDEHLRNACWMLWRQLDEPAESRLWWRLNYGSLREEAERRRQARKGELAPEPTPEPEDGTVARAKLLEFE